MDILIVDDNQAWRNTFIAIMETEQCSFETATNYGEASRALLTHHFELIVLDIRLVDADPDNEDGLRLLADIEQAGLDTKVIIATGYGAENHKQTAARNANLLAFIHKGELELSKFRELIRQALSRAKPEQSS